jgi:addiction module HigA family antidote
MMPLNLSAYRVAKDLGVAPLRITEIVHGKRAISAETALLLSRYTGTSPQFWINLQGQYHLEIVNRLAIPGRKKKIPRRVALEESKRGRARREGLSELNRKTTDGERLKRSSSHTPKAEIARPD